MAAEEEFPAGGGGRRVELVVELVGREHLDFRPAFQHEEAAIAPGEIDDPPAPIGEA